MDEKRDLHPVLSLIIACFSVFFWLLTWVQASISFLVLSLPKWIYAILSYSFTLTLNFYALALLFCVTFISLSFLIRFRYLSSYKTLRELPLNKPGASELHPDVNNPDEPASFRNYLDEFLQAIRVFGFLEKPVFHELARHLQTRRLIAGDTISLDADKSFYCVVDGHVQVFAPPREGGQGDALDADWGSDMNGYQLLNEVGSGGTLSKYFESTAGASSHAHASHAPLQQGIIARATIDTTLAVIPAEAFRRLTQKFPKASAHIVQVILTRFSRVTFQSAHKYLGLTSELLRTEKAINDIACHPLPATFYEGGGIENLRQLFQQTGSVNGESEASEDESDYVNQSDEGHTQSSNRAQTGLQQGKLRRGTIGRTFTGATSLSSASTATIVGSMRLTTSAVTASPVETTARSASAISHVASTNSPTSKSPITPFRSSSSRTGIHAGDLMTSTGRLQDTLHGSRSTTTPHIGRRLSGSSSSLMREAGRLQSEDFDLREEVMSCIAKSIGLLQPPLSGTDSTQASPMPLGNGLDFSKDQSNAMFNASFSSLLQGDDAASSMSSSLNSTGQGGYMTGLDNEVEILSFPAGSLIVKAGEKNSGLFYVIDGLLDVSIPIDSSPIAPSSLPQHASKQRPKLNPKGRQPSRHSTTSKQDESVSETLPQTTKHLFTVKPGGIAGYLASLSGTPSYVDIRAKTDVYVGLLPSKALERLLEKKPIVLLTLAKRLITLLSPLVLHVDSSMDWTQLDAGQVLWRPGDASDSFYIVLNGRLRAITEQENGEINIVGEYGQGDTIGELDAITNQLRHTTLHAIRDTELARMPMTLFNAISARHPRTTVQLLRMIATKVRDEVGSVVHSSKLPSAGPASGIDLSGRTNLNLKTVAIIPSNKNVPVDLFARRLQNALEDIGAPTSFLNQSAVMRHLGKHAFTRIGKLKVAGWLSELEQRYRIVLYVADSPVGSPWTQTCIRQVRSIQYF
ncbi:phosphatidylcholine and lysophosphatidylcholine phospholipase [Serendipita sp. 401]|nr:phosphatidylcholine and lysophosphatidylcholine phospholipase [Serendipita sp. 401]